MSDFFGWVACCLAAGVSIVGVIFAVAWGIDQSNKNKLQQMQACVTSASDNVWVLAPDRQTPVHICTKAALARG